MLIVLCILTVCVLIILKARVTVREVQGIIYGMDIGLIWRIGCLVLILIFVIRRVRWIRGVLYSGRDRITIIRLFLLKCRWIYGRCIVMERSV